ncbi:putative reverse transcriptase Ty1/copia-type domain-containing protein [Phytophthora infestans]|uniref:Putative reverse transcriptase Ty1/copia-type domain-containing protein n=1 Tax=Phytophthora infestans TaxID=4787 RepID=A0A8S9UV56_PHYIN|nr:putative reverse transcriptase Ty1/copia-type domain-containing protein [Phytophthora infestans]
MALVYKQDESAKPVELLTDADWANNTEDRKSISGVVVRVYGCAVAWVTRRQSVVAKSSTAAEFIAASIGVEEARWTRMLLQSLSGRAATAIAARVDNQSTIARIVNGKSSEAQKTVDCMFFDMKDAFKRGEVVITYCPTEEMVADFLTKALNRLRLKKMLELIGLQDIKR